VFRGHALSPRFTGEEHALQRHELIGGFSQAALEKALILLIGAGGLNGEVALGLIKKGAAAMTICEPDKVEMSNLNRQPFTRKQLGQPKAYALGHNLAEMAVTPTEITAIPLAVQQAVELGLLQRPTVAICGVDNDETRVFSHRWARSLKIPIITMAVTYNADFGYCFVSEPGKEDSPCFGCLYPEAIEQRTKAPCVVGSSIDILKVMAGLTLYAIDSLLMDRPRFWNYKEVSLDGGREERQLVVLRRAECPVCNVG